MTAGMTEDWFNSSQIDCVHPSRQHDVLCYGLPLGTALSREGEMRGHAWASVETLSCREYIFHIPRSRIYSQKQDICVLIN
jgi:hypothetical protein